MECTGKLKSVSKNWISRKWEVTFEINEDITASIDKIRDKLLNLTAKIHREKRSQFYRRNRIRVQGNGD